MAVNRAEKGLARIGVLTFHIAHNYGAMLQAYALPIALKKLGYACEVIDYRFPYIDQWGRVEWLTDLVAKYGLLMGSLRYLKRRIRGSYAADKKQIKFAKFERDVMRTSKKVYYAESELKDLPYDAILFGSDQIWNTDLTNGLTAAYVGNFPTLAKTKKIAYAASCGRSDLNEDCKDIYLKCLADFSALGIREEGFTATLRENGLPAETVLDPSLLLDRNDWMEMVKKVSRAESIAEPYLLIYAFDEDERVYDIARQLAKEKRLKIVVIAYERKACMEGAQVLTECGPADFVSLFANAELVLTTSFHGTAFSVIMNKPFYCFPHPKYHERTDSLLKLLQLESRNVTDLDHWSSADEIDWSHVHQLLSAEQKRSYGFLKQALAGCPHAGRDS